MKRGVFGEHLRFYIQTCAERGRPARGVTFRLIEQRTLSFNDSSASRAGAVYLLKCCNKAECQRSETAFAAALASLSDLLLMRVAPLRYQPQLARTRLHSNGQ